ncbi:filamentous hemagglutinin N-terminal domain-containing protein [Nostoc flagelliforme FACHB-838]|uniref:Filamentous hemagglutinin N-terminal domain-containing protein n=1 Tax=Nostoc flagelliforme FACHB-838 TaxID=2692904 RepID=A0ABR8DU52_9NOSO|nr:filamentous hemagglutinin N-terminal domain-containing protein [Nostoc flagelliforme]MBD2532911.1 filamentous hemagglutinin N-terminal domain-containing protein [Nostoc flagelliforme FACHB-838]
MIIKSWFGRGWQWKIGGYVSLVGILSIGVSDHVLAQIVPDNTLGVEGSVVKPNVNIQGIPSDRIDGGATRGANLFHSLQNFNVGEGKGAYFANPTGIENILTRVTGGNPSNILGRLGVLGEANLFLLNPNGIVFGPNASLDIQGSFVATTADRIKLGDSGYFSATQPQTSSLLSVTPGALFFNAVASQPGSIINRGNLSTPKHLTLAAGNLDLQGQLKALGDLTLQAQDTVKVRDSVTTPFLAQSGGNLTIIGNSGIDILALNHPTQTPLVSGGNLSLASDGVISLDARFTSGGSFSIKSISGGLGNFVSYYDPIISAEGDVDVAANYTGTSLLVEATGNIRFGGDINITGLDTSTLPPGTDTATLSRTSVLIMRSEQSALAYGGVNSGAVPTASNGPVPAGITLGGNVTLQPFNGAGGIVNLLAASGNVSTQEMTTNGGTIEIFSGGAILTNGKTLDTTNGGNNGGSINLTAQNNITTGNLSSGSSSISGNAGEGGAIHLAAAAGNITTGNLNSDSLLLSFSGNAGEGGAIHLAAAAGDITTGDLNSGSLSSSGDAGEGGAIHLAAAGDITTGNLNSDSFKSLLSFSGNRGDLTLTAQNSITTGSYWGSFSNGGNITLRSTGGGIDTSAGTLNSASYGAGIGGDITLTAQNDILTGNLYSSSSRFGKGGNITLSSTVGSIDTSAGTLNSTSYGAGIGGDITLTAQNDILTGNLYSFSYGLGNGGAVNLTAANDIFIDGNLYSFSYSPRGTAGQGGAISLQTRGGDISGRGNQSKVLGSFSISEQGNAGNGGKVTLEAKNNLSNLEIFTLSSDSQSGAVQVKGLGDLVLTDTNILTSKQVTVPNPFLFGGPFITLDIGRKGQSGNVDVTSSGNLTFNNSSIQSDTKGSDPAGNVTVSSPGLVTFNNSSIKSNTSDTGAAGSIDIKADQGITLVGSVSELFAGTSNQGEAGDITLITPQLTLSDTARITATATSTATNPLGGGSITLNASTMNLTGVVGVFAETQGQTPAGTLTLKPYENQSTLNLTLAPLSLVSASTTGSGKGGNLIVQAPEAITIQGPGTLAVKTTGDGAAGNLSIDTQKLTIADGATISASTDSKNPEGTGGSIDIKATESFNLTNASLSAESTGAAPAGKVTIDTPNLTATNGTIATSSNESSGGGITITADKIHLFGNSDITTNVNQGAGEGGKIDLKAGSILAFDDSDILAFARDGKGGDITLDTRAFLGENYSPASSRNDSPNTLNGNNRVDVNATGAFDGVITIPDVSFIQNSLTELPENQINTESLLANSCIVRRNQPTRGSFTITGTGGLPQRPGDVQMSSFPTVDVETLPSDSTLSNTNSNRPWQKGDPIVEPQGVYRLSNGKLVMSRECS